MSAGSSEPPLERVLTLRGPITRERPYSDTVWYAREEHRLMSSEAPVEICKGIYRVMHGILWRAHHKTKVLATPELDNCGQTSACRHQVNKAEFGT